MGRYWRVLLIGAIYLILVGVWVVVPRLRSADSVVTHLPPATGMDRRWLEGIPCAPPCWEGVTPGQTTVQTAFRIWNAAPSIMPGSVFTEEHQSVDYHLSGSIFWGRTDGVNGGYAQYHGGASDPIIDSIQLNPNGSFTLDEVIKRYGPPTHISANAGYGIEGQGPAYSFAVFYHNYGIKLGPVEGYQQKPELSPQTTFDRVSFYPVSQKPQPWETPWRGFQGFDAYCADNLVSGRPCPTVPLLYPHEVLLGVDGLLGLVVGWGFRSRQGTSAHPMGDRLWRGLLGLLVLCGLATGLLLLLSLTMAG